MTDKATNIALIIAHLLTVTQCDLISIALRAVSDELIGCLKSAWFNFAPCNTPKMWEDGVGKEQ